MNVLHKLLLLSLLLWFLFVVCNHNGSEKFKHQVLSTFLKSFCFLFSTANQENPELIWNTEAREKICSVVKQLKDK